MVAKFSPQADDALLVVDVQNDFLPGGKLGVRDGDAVVPVLNRYIEAFAEQGLPIVYTRDWHPQDHCSFQAQGGPWPVHCVAETDGAAFAPELVRPDDAIVISKADSAQSDAYSGFEGTELASKLRERGVNRVFVGGLTTDYCVLNTVKDALAQGFDVYFLEDAIRAVNVEPDDGPNAIAEMLERGARSIDLQTFQST